MVEILLSTYNSQSFLEELLLSIQSQSYQNWKLIVRDDCSTDQTISILKDFKKANPTKLIFVNDHSQRLGPKRSFECLLENSSSEYIMFCDHDDYWQPNKIQDSIQKIKELEKGIKNKPALIFTDLTIVDHSLKIIHPSFWEYSKVNPNNIINTYRLAINNPVVGCTLIINKAAKSLALPFPQEAIMHDWWIALKVSECGLAAYLNKSTILYRQHTKNKIGAEQINGSYIKNRLSNISQTINQNISAYKMLKCLSKDYSIIKLAYYKIYISISKLF